MIQPILSAIAIGNIMQAISGEPCGIHPYKSDYTPLFKRKIKMNRAKEKARRKARTTNRLYYS